MKELFEQRIKSLILQRNYPCVAAIQAFARKDYQAAFYAGFGEGRFHQKMASDLVGFRDEYHRTRSTYLSFFAVFEDAAELDEEEFEARMWKELSYLCAAEGFKKEWDPEFSSNPEDKNFCFSLDGTAFFVVGLHPKSSRKSRQFPVPTLVFNVYEQFRDLQKKGEYDSMVQLNRKRDLAFQGSANPMAETHGDTWESIQFSGRANSSEWKCPFHHGLKPTPPNP